jgi:starch phosphorylase
MVGGREMTNKRQSNGSESMKAKSKAGGTVSENGAEAGAYDRHLTFDHVVRAEEATARERFEAIARTLRDRLATRWLETGENHDRKNAKQVCYLSMEFLVGRTLVNNVVNLKAENLVRESLARETRADWTDMVEAEPDAGLGNGGLGRLAACFIDSLATLDIPAVGYGLRYEYGIFRQAIENGCQVEQPDHWLAHPDPWEVARPDRAIHVPMACSFKLENGELRAVPGRATHLIGVPHDRPVVGYGGKTVNTLRLWRAASPDFFDFGEFNTGDFIGAIVDRAVAETVTRVLYPDDSTLAGQALRFVQEYFLVSCSLGDIVSRFRRLGNDWPRLPDKVAIQLNDTHPAIAVAELMRILLDEGGMGWDAAWDAVVRTLAYTNHTLLPEALEKWPVQFFELICPRLLEIIYEINRRFLDQVRAWRPDDPGLLPRMSMVEEVPARQIRMAHLAIVGSHSTNGVAQIHSDLLRTRVVRDFAEMYPERFNNKTNGVTPRRWLLAANPELSTLVTDAIGDGWVANLAELNRLRPFATDAGFQESFARAKRNAKDRFATWLKDSTGTLVDPQSIFDSQIKRIHEYKRQLLNLLHCAVLYRRIRGGGEAGMPPRTFFFAGKAAPAYHLAKLIIRLINAVGQVVDADPAARGRLKLAFLPNYTVSLAERLIPATEVSEQISTAGYEASGTGNMKFMMNGALTIGTRDGATIEMAAEAGEENFFLFGLTAEQVFESRGTYDPRWHYANESEIRDVVDWLFGPDFQHGAEGVFAPIRAALFDKGDYFMHLADLTSYSKAHRALGETYGRRDDWNRMAILNVAGSGKFSSDRTISEYARDIWNAIPCPVAD